MNLRRAWLLVSCITLGLMGIGLLFVQQWQAEAAPELPVPQSEVPSSLVYLPLLSNGYVPPEMRLCRFGVGAGQSIVAYDVHPLKLGWYVDWTTTLSPAQPGGIEYMPMVRLAQTGSDSFGYDKIPVERILQIAASQPGATWLIGNEPDSPFQDSLVPSVYAKAYHDTYHLIKSADPTAQIAAGAIVQPTPLRLQYLDMVLDTYTSTYGVQMPVDVWNIHAFILREEAGSWGAWIPPGIDVTKGMLYEIDDNGSVPIFKEGIERFRDWMADNGYQNRPLIITEFGIQMPSDYGFPPERVRSFLNETFDYLSTASDPDTGYPADDYRLVQKWAWYSLTDDNFNGWLFDGTSKERTVHGDSFADYAAGVSGTVNLLPLAVGVGDLYTQAGEIVSATLTASIANNGNMLSPGASVTFYLGDPESGGQEIGAASVWGLQGCADTATVEVLWTSATAGSHEIYVVADPSNYVQETDETDNVLAQTVVVSP